MTGEAGLCFPLEFLPERYVDPEMRLRSISVRSEQEGREGVTTCAASPLADWEPSPKYNEGDCNSRSALPFTYLSLRAYFATSYP